MKVVHIYICILICIPLVTLTTSMINTILKSKAEKIHFTWLCKIAIGTFATCMDVQKSSALVHFRITPTNTSATMTSAASGMNEQQHHLHDSALQIDDFQWEPQ